MLILIFTKLYWLWLALAILILDLSSKYLVMTNLPINEPIPILPCINMFHTYNSGAAFGFLSQADGWQRWVFIFIAIIAVIILLIAMYHTNYYNYFSKTIYSVIIGGILGNLFDRIFYGVVIDFIDFHIKDWHWPTFNVADLAICSGGILIMLKDISVFTIEFIKSSNKD